MTQFFHFKRSLKYTLAAGCAIVALAATPMGSGMAFAEQGSGQGKQMQGGQGGKGAGGGHGQGGQMGQGGQGKGLGGIFKDITGMDDPVTGRGGSADSGHSADAADEGDDDSDRPEWAGEPGGKDGAGGGQPATSGSKKGDLFGDLWIIDRDSNGVPILTADGYVQPLDADGNPIELDEEGHPVDETLTVEVELGRLNVGRAPTSVLDNRADEVITILSSATAISTDASGRLVLTVDGEDKTIDSPLENLAIYVSLLTTGSIPDLTPDDLAGTDYDFLVDGKYTQADLDASAAFLAAATDKTGVFTSDEIAYIDAFLGINTTTIGNDVTYSDIDYSSFSYDRSDTYSGVTATVLVEQADGSFDQVDVDIYDAVFGSVDVSAAGSLDAYTQAADDSRAVIEFIHEYAVPETL
ncbi:hypothetical protein SAMN05444414_11270 [Roseovarius marisflavi]|uniref:Uncharacterized protein n=1 Tax=Roseovarius marisflavi TaxID=1054996 RepID=A0A1M7A5X1_9RHOB|nr:hypothetical protein [Roseovarius marisflavi]SHL38137.1 hypothetical protein SAMN05444414_11270 [Roseovarius marisflavi]